eukprot:SAG22_NODE_2517_length_2487_cov_8.070352_2_plen_190_part_00
MALSLQQLSITLDIGSASILTLQNVSVTQYRGVEQFSGTVYRNDDGVYSYEPVDLWRLHADIGPFEVISGPCTVTQGGRCVGRRDGYGQSDVENSAGQMIPAHETCQIGPGGGGLLGPCGVFDTFPGGDFVTLYIECENGGRCGQDFSGTNCPEGIVLTSESTVSWWAGGGLDGHGIDHRGAGWQICFV